jgi:hypothetical protein
MSLWCVVLVARAAQGDTDRASSSAKLVHNPLAPLSIFQGFIWKPSNIIHSKYKSLWSRRLLVRHWCVVLVAKRRSAVPGVLSEVPRVSQRRCWCRLWLA